MAGFLYVCLFIHLVGVLTIESSAFCMPGKHSTIKLHVQPWFHVYLHRRRCDSLCVITLCMCMYYKLNVCVSAYLVLMILCDRDIGIPL